MTLAGQVQGESAMRIVMAGCGNMGFAMLAAWMGEGMIARGDALVVEPNEALRVRAAGIGATVFATASDIPAETAADLVVLAVKPQVMGDVAPQYRRFTEKGAAALSIAAGTKIAFFESIYGANAAIIRCMPNTPAAIGAGMMVLCPNARVKADTMDAVRALLACNGEVADVADETLMDPVTAVSGSGPAYVFHFIECLTAAAEKTGLTADVAALLARQTVLGAAMLAARSSETPATLRQQVTSPNGTTAAALAVMMGEARMEKLVTEAVEAARARSVELSA